MLQNVFIFLTVKQTGYHLLYCDCVLCERWNAERVPRHLPRPAPARLHRQVEDFVRTDLLHGCKLQVTSINDGHIRSTSLSLTIKSSPSYIHILRLNIMMMMKSLLIVSLSITSLYTTASAFLIIAAPPLSASKPPPLILSFTNQLLLSSSGRRGAPPLAAKKSNKKRSGAGAGFGKVDKSSSSSSSSSKSSSKEAATTNSSSPFLQSVAEGGSTNKQIPVVVDADESKQQQQQQQQQQQEEDDSSSATTSLRSAKDRAATILREQYGMKPAGEQQVDAKLSQRVQEQRKLLQEMKQKEDSNKDLDIMAMLPAPVLIAIDSFLKLGVGVTGLLFVLAGLGITVEAWSKVSGDPLPDNIDTFIANTIEPNFTTGLLVLLGFSVSLGIFSALQISSAGAQYKEDK